MLRISCLGSSLVAAIWLVGCSGSSSHHGGGGAAGSSGAGGAGPGTAGSSPMPQPNAGGPGSNGGGPGSNGGGPGSNGGGPGSNGGGPGSNGGAPSSGPISLEQFPAAFAAAACSRMFECCTAEELGMSPLGASEAQCKALFTTAATSLTAPLKASVAAGRVEYDGELVRECLMDYATTSCMALRSSGDIMGACEEFAKPKVALDGACSHSYDCIESYCASETHTCQAKKPNGSACADEDDECQSDFCDGEMCAVPPVGEAGLCTL